VLTALRRGLITIVVWLALSGGIVTVLLWERVTESRITSSRLNHFPQIVADRVWFRSPRELIAHRLHDGEIRVHSVPVPLGEASPGYRSAAVDAVTPAHIAVDPDGARAVWSAGGKIKVADLTGLSSNLSADLPGSDHVVAVAPNGLAVAVSSAGEMKVFDTNKLQLLREQTISIRDANRIETSGTFVAVGNLSNGDVGVYDLRSPRLNMVEYRRFAARLLAIGLSSAGRIVVATERGSVLAGPAIAAPGLVRAIDFFERDRFLVGGDFPGVHVIAAANAPREVVRSPKGAVAVASNGGHVAVATASGLELHSYHYGVGISKRGRDILAGWLVLTFVLMAAAFLKLIRHFWKRLQMFLFGFLLPGAATREGVPEKPYADLLEAPPDLVKAVAASECILVAGEELSKPCGIPLWRSFVLALIEWAEDCRHIDQQETEQSRELHRIGQFDRVAHAILDRLQGSPGLVADFAQRMYLKTAALSNVHEALGTVPFAGAVTPNLDTLLERALAFTPEDLFLPNEIAKIGGRVSEKRRFALKIRGHWEPGAGIVLVPSQAIRQCARTAEYQQMITFLLTTRTLLFIGMSLDDVQTLIEPATLEKTPGRKHYVIVPRSEAPKRVDATFRRSSVRVFAYTDGDTQQVCDFLEKLRASEQARMAAAPSGAGSA
jgi:hypothetical protein